MSEDFDYLLRKYSGKGNVTVKVPTKAFKKILAEASGDSSLGLRSVSDNSFELDVPHGLIKIKHLELKDGEEIRFPLPIENDQNVTIGKKNQNAVVTNTGVDEVEAHSRIENKVFARISTKDIEKV